MPKSDRVGRFAGRGGTVSVLLCAPEVAPIMGVLESVRLQRGPAAVHGLAPGLVVDDPTGWIPASRFTDGSALPALLTAARDRWGASPAAAAALAWKSYTYWLSLPAVIGYAAAGRVPDLSPGNVLIQVPGADPFLRIGLRRPTVEVTGDLAGYLRRTMLDGHLDAVLEGLRGLVHIGRRTMLGS